MSTQGVEPPTIGDELQSQNTDIRAQNRSSRIIISLSHDLKSI